MEASLRQFYEKKIQRLEIDNFHLQEELYSRPTDQYKLKYQLLLSKIADENQLKESKKSEQFQNHEKMLAEVNSKWEKTLQIKTNELKATIQQLQNENKALSIKNTELQMKSVRLQREIDEGDSQILRLKFDSMKKQNQRLKKQVSEAYNHCQQQFSQIKLETEERIEQVKQRQKICYRQQIYDLQKRILELTQELQLTKIRASPEREVVLQEFQKRLLREKQQQTEQIVRMASILQTRNKEIKSIKELAQKKDEIHMSNIKQLSQKLKNYETKLFQASLERQMALLQLKKQLESKRAKQADELKEQLSKVMYGFQRQRQEWRHIITQFETQNGKIKKDWQEQKIKYIDEKKKLKDKIAELRKRLNQNQERAKDETDKLLKSLKELHSNEEQFTNYENGITFMDRQVRKSTIKIREQDIEINNLLTELKTLQQQTQKQIAYTREKAREEVKQLYDKVFALEDQNDRLEVQLKQLEKVLKRKEKEIEVQKEGHKEDIAQYKLIIQQMERDYKRVASHKKNLEDSYREERENVITSKIDVNQERKNKWTVLARQKGQLQLVFRQRQNQLRSNYEVELDKLKRQKHEAVKQMESFRAQNQALKQRLEEKQNVSKQSSYSDYQAKLATLDLELVLTQNLFKNLAKATAKKQPHQNNQLLEMSQQSSVRMVSDHEHHHSGQDLLKYGSFYVSNEDQYRIGFSFCPPKKT